MLCYSTYNFFFINKLYSEFLGEFSAAEESLEEATILDPENSLVWGHISLLSVMQSPPKLEQAEKSFNQVFLLLLFVRFYCCTLIPFSSLITGC